MLGALLLAPAASAAPRIVTLAPHLAELVCAIGACKQLAGVVRYTDYPAEAAAKPLVGDAINVNFELLLALKPDLVLVWDGGTSAQTIARLRELELRVEPVRIRTLNDVAKAMHHIGQLSGNSAGAGLAVNFYYHRLDRLRRDNAGKSKLRVMYQIELDPIYTITERSPINEAITLCGGENIFARLPQIAPTVGREAVLAANPDVVLFTQQDDVRGIRKLWRQWPKMRAAAFGTLYTLDANLMDRQAPRLLDGVEQLCQALDQARARLGNTPAAR